MKNFAIALAAVLAATTAGNAGADTLNFPDFSDTSRLQLNGSAARVTTGGRTVLRLTPSAITQAGSVFSTDRISLSNNYSFSTRFTFNINTPLNGGADGLVFVIQPNANNVGGGGGGIGYEGIGNSLGVEFDTWNNGAVDGNSGNHVGINLNGSIDSVRRAPAPFQLDGGSDLTAWVDYDGANNRLEVRLNNALVRPEAALLSYDVDLATVIANPNAFVGFTSGTGVAASNHDLVNWTFVDNFAPVADVPEPASWAMMIVGAGLVGGVARRRTRAAIRSIA